MLAAQMKRARRRRELEHASRAWSDVLTLWPSLPLARVCFA
jgi:hypothetical protein